MKGDPPEALLELEPSRNIQVSLKYQQRLVPSQCKVTPKHSSV